ncbi:D-xylose isomerase [Silicimonas algicola]|uniref:Xylose isomerase n=2 Tax=Silicimonas algicola TaxID=1826607 RepID=A0A316G3E4_9RHOB|nr:D-xylose isomerase [Silicimonas algicola]
MSFFKDIPSVAYEGPETSNDFAYRHYDPDAQVAGRRMEDHLRFAVAYWHSFAWEGGDPFGGRTFDRPWFGSTMDHARTKADVAFEMFRILGQPFFCFHDADARPEVESYAENTKNLEAITDYIGGKMEETGTRLLWGTANLFSHRRFMSGASTNPDPDVFAYAAATIKANMDATRKLNGENYVLWGGREGYETLLNTDLGREADQMARMLSMVVDYKHKTGFKGTILVEPKPQEPTKHQYDYDVAACYAFLKRYGLEDEVKLNIEQGHAILAGHTFEHEVALAMSLGVFGSIDMNRNDYQSGWDTDQFPNNVPEVAMVYYEILKAGGFQTGGTNFDSKLRRQSLDPEDLILAHVGAMDVCAQGLKAAAAMLEDGSLEAARRERYAGWDSDRGKKLMSSSLEEITEMVLSEDLQPEPRSGRQERLENLVNRFVQKA